MNLPLLTGSEGDDVRTLQRRLGIEPDGTYGPATTAAVLSFQRARNLRPTGQVDEATAKALGLISPKADYSALIVGGVLLILLVGFLRR